ncbi:MAG: class I SAM-dependent methyltransferase [Planctomycetota bacterium]|nr:class I SAM-dependent methyltransferase [Planctomycetota bacterium]
MTKKPIMIKSLKRLALAAYNPLVNHARHYFKWACAFATKPWSSCSVCGRPGPKRFVTESVPDSLITMWALEQNEANALRIKESMTCPWCGAKYRGRRLAGCLLQAICPNGHQYKSLRDLVKAMNQDPPAAHHLFQPILILNWIDGLSDILKTAPNLVMSELWPNSYIVQTEFFDGITPGNMHQGIRHEDAQNLTFPDASFGLVISSETLEHIPNLDQALSEIHRVLVPDGSHIFTIPLKKSVLKTECRASLDSNGQIKDQILPRLHHPGGFWGWPVFTEFGGDYPQVLSKKHLKVQVNAQELLEQSGSIDAPICPVFIVSRS